MSLFLDRAEKAVNEGATLIVKWNEMVIKNWTHNVPFATQASRSATEVMRVIRTSDLIWQWVSLGTAPVDIVGKLMIFPFQGRGMSYNAKTDTGRTGNSRDGRTGEVKPRFNVSTRSIKARNLPKKAIEGNLDFLFNVMEGIINGR